MDENRKADTEKRDFFASLREDRDDRVEVDVTSFIDSPSRRDDELKLEMLRLVDALGLERTERLLRSIRRSVPSGHDLSWSGQTLATHVLREWINTSHVEYLTPNEAWDKTGEILRAYLTGGR